MFLIKGTQTWFSLSIDFCWCWCCAITILHYAPAYTLTQTLYVRIVYVFILFKIETVTPFFHSFSLYNCHLCSSSFLNVCFVPFLFFIFHFQFYIGLQSIALFFFPEKKVNRNSDDVTVSYRVDVSLVCNLICYLCKSLFNWEIEWFYYFFIIIGWFSLYGTKCVVDVVVVTITMCAMCMWCLPVHLCTALDVFLLLRWFQLYDDDHQFKSQEYID